MLVLVKSAPDTTDGMRGMMLAREAAADVVLLQNGVYFADGNAIGEFSGRIYALEDDVKLRGIDSAMAGSRIQGIDYDGLVDIMTENDKVVGMF
ncbi:MAG: hypothetical protein HZA20_01530 [Nitrospirae bacterium]|nr:hypothetical protein [Nitrospirota bacterium]